MHFENLQMALLSLIMTGMDEAQGEAEAQGRAIARLEGEDESVIQDLLNLEVQLARVQENIGQLHRRMQRQAEAEACAGT